MSLQTVRSGATAHPEEMFDFLMSHLIDQSGVKSIAADGDMYVEESDTPAMTVKINLGYAFIKKSDNSKAYPVRLYSAAEEGVITANASGNPRIDAVVLYINLGATPNADATNVAEIAVVAGTPAASPSAPSDGDIQTAIGATYPFIRLANVTVASGASEILNANIDDTRPRAFNVKKNSQYEVEADAATVTFDVEKGNGQVTVTANRQLAVENYQAGDEFKVKIIQDAGGTNIPVWWSGIDWDGGVAPVFTITGDRADVFAFKVKSDLRFEGYIVGQGMTLS